MEGIYPPTFTHSEPFVTIARAPERQGPNATFGPANQNTWLRVKKKVDENARDADFTRFTQFGGYFCPVIVYVGHDRVQPRKGEAKTRLNQNIREHTLTHTHTHTEHYNITTEIHRTDLLSCRILIPSSSEHVIRLGGQIVLRVMCHDQYDSTNVLGHQQPTPGYDGCRQSQQIKRFSDRTNLTQQRMKDTTSSKTIPCHSPL
jgi:hypothetical protein